MHEQDFQALVRLVSLTQMIFLEAIGIKLEICWIVAAVMVSSVQVNARIRETPRGIGPLPAQ